MRQRSTISSSDLKHADIPRVDATWPEISRFALTFDCAEDDPYRLTAQLSGASEADRIPRVRALLFAEQRRFNHWGRKPDTIEMVAFHRVLELIRQKLQDSGAGL